MRIVLWMWQSVESAARPWWPKVARDVIGTEFWEGGMKRQSWRDDHGPDFFLLLK